MRKIGAAIGLAGLAVLVAACSASIPDAPHARIEPVLAEVGEPRLPDEAVLCVLDERSRVEFMAAQLTGTHQGGFRNLAGQIALVEGRPELSGVRIEIDTRSVWSDRDRLTEHLRSADFFAVDSYPRATFVSTGVTPESGGLYQVRGRLELRGEVREIVFPASIEIGVDAVRANAAFKLLVAELGIEPPGLAGEMLREEILVQLDLQAPIPPSMGP